MKRKFIWLLLDPATETKKGGFSEEEKAELKASLTEVQTALETKNKEVIATAIKSELKTINEGIEKFKEWQGARDEADKKNQEALDKIIAQVKDLGIANDKPREIRSFKKAMAEEMAKKENIEAISAIGKAGTKGQKVRIVLDGPISMKEDIFETVEFKSVANLTLSNNLTGDSVATYRQQPVLLPSQKINFRDLIPMVPSETGLYITYPESAGEVTSSDWRQTEGSAKNQIDFDFSEAKTVNKFIAAFVRFSKQAQRSLPFLNNTLPRQLLREFYKYENRYFYDVLVTGATGSGTSVNTVHIKRINDFIGSQRQANYNASYVLVSHIQWAEIMNELITNGNYFAAGGVTGTQAGVISFSGVPVVPASWVPSNDVAVVFDTDYVERVEVENVAVEFFEQDSDNVQKNLITARIECYEELNRMVAGSVIVGDLGDTATS